MNVTILYFTKTGHTLEAAKAVAEGIESAGSEVTVVSVHEFSPDALANTDALIVASPCWAGSITPSGVSRPVVKALQALPPDCLSGKRCGGVAVHSATGGKRTVATLGRLLASKGCTDYLTGPAAKAGSGLSLWKGPSVQPDDEERFKAYGADFVA